MRTRKGFAILGSVVVFVGWTWLVSSFWSSNIVAKTIIGQPELNIFVQGYGEGNETFIHICGSGGCSAVSGTDTTTLYYDVSDNQPEYATIAAFPIGNSWAIYLKIDLHLHKSKKPAL
jgi:hypothetical protein